MTYVDVLNPVAEAVSAKIELAPRSTDLREKTIGLYMNSKKGADITLDRVAELLSLKYDGLKFKYFSGSQGLLRSVTTEDADRIARESDAVIAAIGD